MTTVDGFTNFDGDATIKAEPMSPTAQVDEDLYEDAGDLSFAEYHTDVFLARIPQYLWKTWLDLEDEQDIQIGTLRVEGAVGKPQSVRSPHFLRSSAHS